MAKNFTKNIIRHVLPKSIAWRLYLYKWRILNKKNYTRPVRHIPLDLIKIGNGTYGNINLLSYYGHEKLIIGNFCSIGENVSFLLGVDHPLTKISTYPFEEKILGEKRSYSKGDIIIDDDVWVGYGCTILSGVHIGQGAVIAAGAVVTNDVPPYAIIGGVPAKIIKYRFSANVIEKLLKINFSNLKKEIIIDIRDILNKEITDDNIILIKNKLSKYGLLCE